MSVVRLARLQITARSASVRDRVEGAFLQALLQAFEDALHRRCGGAAVLCVQHLSLQATVGEGDLAGGTMARSLGEELANSVLDRLDRGAEGVVSFRSEGARRAAWLAVIAREEGESAPWWAIPLGVRASDVAAWAADPAAVAAALEALDHDGTLAATIRHLPHEIFVSLAAAVPVSRWPAAAIAAWTARPRARESNDNRPSLDDEATPRPTRARAGRSPDHAAGPRRPADPPADDPVTEESPDSPSTIRPVDGSADEFAALHRHEAARPGAAASPAPDSSSPRLDDPVRPTATTGADPDVRRAVSHPVDERHEDDDEALEEDDEASDDHHDADGDAPTAWRTEAAGVFLLVRPALVLGIAEILWEAGLREGEVIAAAAIALLGPGFEDDPAPELLGGAAPRPVPVSEWAIDELRGRLQAALLDAFGVVDITAQPSIQVHGPPGWPEAVALVAQTLSAAFRLPLGDDDPVARWLIGEGRVIDAGDRLVVVRPMSAVDIDLRRAALDRDPGYVPWLSRTVVFVYESESW